jgi:hypothetical protein
MILLTGLCDFDICFLTQGMNTDGVRVLEMRQQGRILSRTRWNVTGGRIKYIKKSFIIFVVIIISGSTVIEGSCPSHTREVSLIYLDSLQDSFGRVISPSQRPLPT